MSTPRPSVDKSVRAPTMADVARIAGVSVPTVSRLLSGSAPVSAATRSRVQAVIDELGFRPSAAARLLASGRAEVIAVITGGTSIYGYAESIRGVEEAARAEGYAVMISVIDSEQPKDIERTISSVLTQPIAGVVVLKFDPPGVAVLRALPEDVPVVALAGARERSHPQALIDEAEAAETLTSYLLSLGHQTVHHVRIPHARREDARTTGWRRALTKAGAPVPDILDTTWDPHSGRELGRALAQDSDVSAVFCGNDETALGVIRGLFDEGKAVPGDVSVVGFDDHPLADLWFPALTTVRQDFAALGRRGVALLLDEIAGDRRVRISTERAQLIIRESAAAPRMAKTAATM